MISNCQDNQIENECDKLLCKICYENNQKILLQCNHEICIKCLSNWYKTCPWCRTELKLSPDIIKKIKFNNQNNIDVDDDEDDIDSLSIFILSVVLPICCFVILIIYSIIYPS